jgi:hypothetical protein
MRWLASASALILACWPAFCQQEFKDPESKFRIELIGDWRAVSYSDAVGRQKIEFVYRDRSEGLLKISRDNLGGRTLAELVHDEEESLKIYRAGLEIVGKEPFSGALRGIRFSFYYVEGGRHMAATNYYLQDGDSVWVLRFVGKRGVLDIIRNVTDQMARSFRPLYKIEHK